MNVNCDGNENVSEAIIIINFPCKQTITKHAMNQFNLTQFEYRIQNLINLFVFFCFCHSKYYKSITPPLKCNFFMFTFWYGHLILVSIFYQLTFQKNQVLTGSLTNCRQTLQLINFIR